MNNVSSPVSDDESFISASSNDSFTSIPSLSETLQSQFSDVPKNLNVVHINAQSIPAHFHDMLASFDSKNIHAILVSESWLKPCLPSTSYSLPGFVLIRNDRSVGGGGGVAIYLRANIPFSIVNMSAQPSPSNAGEHLFLEVTLSSTKILLGVYYCPSSRINFFSSFENILENLTPSYSHTIIMGDFNTCLLKNDSRSSTFKSAIQSCNLTPLPLGATHHFPNSIPSLLDLILVSSTQHVVKHGQCAADAFSYHDLIYLAYKIRPPKAKHRVMLQRNFAGMDLQKLCEDSGRIDWSHLLAASTIDDKINIFNSKLITLYDLHAPVRPIKMKHLPAPWLTDDIKNLLQRKAAAKTKYKCRPSPLAWEKYTSIRNHCNKVCRDAQRRHIHKSVENSEPAKVWKFLRSMGVGTSRQDVIPKDVDLESLK